MCSRTCLSVRVCSAVFAFWTIAAFFRTCTSESFFNYTEHLSGTYKMGQEPHRTISGTMLCSNRGNPAEVKSYLPTRRISSIILGPKSLNLATLTWILRNKHFHFSLCYVLSFKSFWWFFLRQQFFHNFSDTSGPPCFSIQLLSTTFCADRHFQVFSDHN